MFKVINISPRSAPHHHLRAQEASTVLKRPLLRAPLRRSAQSPPCSWDHTLGHVAHCSAAASLLGPHAVAICPPPPSSSIWHLACWLLPGPEGPSDGRGLFRELCRGWGCPGLASPHRCPHSHSLGDPPTSERLHWPRRRLRSASGVPLLRTQGPATASRGTLPRHRHKHVLTLSFLRLHCSFSILSGSRPWRRESQGKRRD